jgi:DNA-binding transcriptional regulator YiaG
VCQEKIIEIQSRLGLSDGKIAKALGITRQTWRNWRRGSTCPQFASMSLQCIMELRRLDPVNDNLPATLRFRP